MLSRLDAVLFVSVSYVLYYYDVTFSHVLSVFLVILLLTLSAHFC